MITTDRDPRCVFVAGNAGSATVAATFLNTAGIPAQVMGIEGVVLLSPAANNGEVEVWVESLEQADDARRLLTEHEREAAREAEKLQARGPVHVVCEDCGKGSEFPGEQYGSTQTCPHCGEYIDVTDAPEVAAAGAKGTDAI